jgi:hypothetical protein
MTWNPGLTKLQQILSELYPTASRSAEIVMKAQLRAGRIDFSGASLDRWHSILEEADKHEKVLAIVSVAAEEYEAREDELAGAEQEYLLRLEQPTPPEAEIPETSTPAVSPSATTISPTAVRDLLLAAFTAEDLRRLFLYTSNDKLRPLVQRFGSRAGLADMVDETIEYCQPRLLFPDLLSEVKQANPRQYDRFEPLLQGQSAATTPASGIPVSEQRAMLEQELAQRQRNLNRLRAKKAVYAAGEEPLSLLNQIDAELQEIDRIQGELAGLS